MVTLHLLLGVDKISEHGKGNLWKQTNGLQTFIKKKMIIGFVF